MLWTWRAKQHRSMRILKFHFLYYDAALVKRGSSNLLFGHDVIRLVSFVIYRDGLRKVPPPI